MQIISYAFLILFLFGCQKPIESLKKPLNFKDSVIGGNSAAIDEFPFLANIWLEDPSIGFHDHLCGGSLISEKWVLTAAHCMTDEASESTTQKLKPSKLVVVFGSSDRSGQGGQRYKVKSVFIHPQFLWPHHDVALIELATRVTGIKPLMLNSQDQGRILNPKSVIVMGWGLMDLAGRSDGQILQKTTLELIDRKTCQEDEFPRSRGWTIGSDILCAQTNQNRNASCSGDSGGPVIQSINGQYQQVGIISWGSACGGPRSVRSNVDGYASIYDAYYWIQKTAR